MSAVPPPYAPREPVNSSASGPSTSPAMAPPVPSNVDLEFAETTSVTIEWKVSGLRAMYDATKGEAKSKCIKSAVFGDTDNLWEVLWYPNSGVSGGEFASLYLSCVPTAHERDQGVGGKWTRRGLWWFRFEIRATVPDERTNKCAVLANKDAADHTFAVKTANWGWQQFVKRDGLFLNPAVATSDSFLIACSIQPQPQPPAGYWLGLGLPAKPDFTPANTVVQGNHVGSGGGLSAWSGGDGASGGVAGGTTAAGGVKRVVPKSLVTSVGALLDDPLYADVEFVIPPSTSRKHTTVNDSESTASPKRIYATKKLLTRCDYFDMIFTGGFGEVEGTLDEDEDNDELDVLSDSDVEDDAADFLGQPASYGAINISTNTVSTSSSLNRRVSASADGPPPATEHESRVEDQDQDTEGAAGAAGFNTAGEGPVDEAIQEHGTSEVASKGNPLPARNPTGPVPGPKKIRVIVRDAAWSTWWAVLYWLYTDIIYFAPLSSSFSHPSPHQHARHGSVSSSAFANEPKTRRQWIQTWMDEHQIGSEEEDEALGPRPVSAKAIYRLADKLDLPALKLRAFQHICAGLTSQNIPAEVFSRFSSTFGDVRKVQVAYFLKNWHEIKKSETMTQIWQQIRVGKHIGFEEVWPLIVSQLDFRAA